MKNISEDEFIKIFMKNLLKRLIDSYIVDNENLQKIIVKGLVLRNKEYNDELEKLVMKLAPLFIEKFNHVKDIKDIENDYILMRKWIIEMVEKIGSNS